MTESTTNDSRGQAFTLLGFFLPIVGFIVWVILHRTRPLDANSALKGTYFGFIIQITIILTLIPALGNKAKNNQQGTQNPPPVFVVPRAS
jgi:hypothetical protein